MAKNEMVKNIMLLHSEAKVEFYKKYLERYLRILYLSPYINKIFLFDMFCGTGIYENGKKGSPIVAFEEIKKIKNEFPNYNTDIHLIVNDQDESKIENIKNHIGDEYKSYCKFHPRNKDVNELFPELIKYFNDQQSTERNLIFIDPYGYKDVKCETIKKLLENGRTEIILFLPISQMQRFTKKAMESDELMYSHLKEFIYSFFPGEHPIKEQKISALKYIEYIKDALKFDKYYSTSYYIERDSKNYYALFFLSNNIFGFEKILEVKWSLDKLHGRGFQQPKPESLFKDEFEDEQHNINYNYLKSLILNSLASPKSNNELYELILRNEFLPNQLSALINNLIHNELEVDTPNGKIARVTTNMFSYYNYKNNNHLCSVKLRP